MLKQLQKFIFDKPNNKYTWWNSKIDKKFWKPRKDDLIFLVAWPWTWKSTFSLSLALQNAKKWNNVVFYSFEMNPMALIRNFLFACFKIAPEKDEDNSFTDLEKEKINWWIKKISELSVVFRSIHDLDSVNIDWKISIEDMLTDFYDLEFKHNANMIIIDWLWFLKSKWTNSNKEFDHQNAIILELIKFINSESAVPMIILHHLNKSWVDSKKSVSMREIRWSQKIADWCTKIIQLHLEDKETRVTKMIQMKDRAYWIFAQESIYFDKWVYKIYNHTLPEKILWDLL